MKQNMCHSKTVELLHQALQVLDEYDFDDVYGFPTMANEKHSHSTTTRVKRVRFNLLLSTSTTIISRFDMSAEETNNTWWSSHECSQLKHRAKQVATFTRYEGQSFIAATLDQPYDIAKNVVSTYDEDTISKIFADPSKHVGPLMEWCQRSNARRGLERFLSLSDSRAKSIDKHRKTILISSHCDDPATLAMLSQQLSCANRLFSRMIAFVDAAVNATRL
jgi:hypothetical protein